MIRDGTLFRSLLPSPFSGLLVMMMTSPVFVTATLTVFVTLTVGLCGTGSITYAAGVSHQRMQPWCTRGKNQLPASQHQSKELC